MMEPPLKRPRLSVFSNHAPDAQLDTARQANDLTLKSRFEEIFEKYAQDFTGIGDEIDLNTGDIIVNNGHIEGMLDETDTGDSAVMGLGSHALSGKSILRAMTATVEDSSPYCDDPQANEVIMSIETMAEQAVPEDLDDSMVESEDDLFDAHSQETDPLDTEVIDDSVPQGMVQPVLIDSSDDDDDSLFGGQGCHRSSSVDSLFALPRPTGCSNTNDRNSMTTDRDLSDDAILAKFGPNVGAQVLELIQKRSDERIEPAWRIPIDIGLVKRASASPIVESAFEPESSHNASRGQLQLASPKPTYKPIKSVWKPTRPYRRRQPNKLPPEPERQRAESEDPLQEDSRGVDVDRSAIETEHLNNKFCADDRESDEDYVEGGRRKPKALDKVKRKFRGRSETVWRSPHRRSETAQASTEMESGADEGSAQGGPASEDSLRTTDDEPEREISGKTRNPEETIDPSFCRYCRRNFTCKSGVMAHWDRLVRKPAAQVEGDIHDMRYIRAVRPLKAKPVRGPRLTVGDFRTMVELHEGNGMSFKEMADSHALRTHKSSVQLEDVYDRHRSLPGDRHEGKPWSSEEKDQLQEFCRNELTTLATIKRHFKERDEIDIGDKLAEGWLQELNASRPSSNESGQKRLLRAQPASQGISTPNGDILDPYTADPEYLGFGYLHAVKPAPPKKSTKKPTPAKTATSQAAPDDQFKQTGSPAAETTCQQNHGSSVEDTNPKPLHL